MKDVCENQRENCCQMSHVISPGDLQNNVTSNLNQLIPAATVWTGVYGSFSRLSVAC